MTTHVTTHSPARTDGPDPVSDTTSRSRAWTLAGIGAALAGLGVVVTSGMVDAVYDPDLRGDSAAIAERLADQTGTILAFHTFSVVAAVLLVVFAAGLLRRLRAGAGAGADSLAPIIAFSGLVGTAVVSVLGSGLDTEFVFALLEDEDVVDPANLALFNHWIGTIPWLWTLAGLSGLAVFLVARAGGVPRWIGWAGLLLGGLTLLLGISPLQYMAGMTGPVWLLVTALGFCLGDRAHR